MFCDHMYILLEARPLSATYACKNRKAEARWLPGGLQVDGKLYTYDSMMKPNKYLLGLVIHMDITS